MKLFLLQRLRGLLPRRKYRPAPWEGRRAFTFTGIFYAENDTEEGEIVDGIATIVCANGGTVASRPAPPEEDEEG